MAKAAKRKCLMVRSPKWRLMAARSGHPQRKSPETAQEFPG